MNRAKNFAKSQSVLHGQNILCQHVTRVVCNDGSAQDLVLTFGCNHLNHAKSFFFR